MEQSTFTLAFAETAFNKPWRIDFRAMLSLRAGSQGWYHVYLSEPTSLRQSLKKLKNIDETVLPNIISSYRILILRRNRDKVQHDSYKETFTTKFERKRSGRPVRVGIKYWKNTAVAVSQNTHARLHSTIQRWPVWGIPKGMTNLGIFIYFALQLTYGHYRYVYVVCLCALVEFLTRSRWVQR